MGADEAVGVVLFGQKRAASHEPGFDENLEAPRRRFSSGGVAVEEREDVLRITSEQAHVVGGERGAERRNDVADAELRERDNVEITLDEDHTVLFPDRLLGLKQPVNGRVLAEERRLGGVQVLGHALAQHPAAEADNFSRGIGDRKHDPAEKLLAVALAAPVAYQADANRIFERYALLLQMAREARAGLGRISEIEAARRALVDAAPFQIFERALSLAGTVKGVLKIARRPLVKPVETLFFFRAALRAGRLKALDLDAIALADALDRLGESEVIVLHEEVKNAAAGAAPEAAEYALFLVDGEGGRFLRMKGAEPHVVPAGFFEREVVRNDFHDGGAVADSGNRFVRNHTPRLSFAALRSTARDSAGSRNLALPSAISCCAKC